jgi:hypothetical protein
MKHTSLQNIGSENVTFLDAYLGCRGIRLILCAIVCDFFALLPLGLCTITQSPSDEYSFQNQNIIRQKRTVSLLCVQQISKAISCQLCELFLKIVGTHVVAHGSVAFTCHKVT